MKSLKPNIVDYPLEFIALDQLFTLKQAVKDSI